MMNLTGAINHSVPISQFHKGMAAQIFADVRKSGSKIVIKNNEPECVLLSPEDYVAFMDELAEAQLELLALRRVAEGALAHTVTQEELMKDLGVTQEELDAMGEVELD